MARGQPVPSSRQPHCQVYLLRTYPRREAAGAARGDKRMLKRLGVALLVLGLYATSVVVPRATAASKRQPAPRTKSLAPRPGPQIILQWDFSAPERVSPGGFQVERADGEGRPWRVVGHVAPTARTWTDQAVQPGTTYCYRVSTLSGTAGDPSSAPSNVACGQTSVPLPRSQTSR